MARKGLPKSIIKKYGISKKAWRVYKGGKGKSRKKASSPKRRKRSNPKRGGGRVARTRRFSISLGVVGGLVAGLAGPVQSMMGGDYEYALKDIGRRYTGFDADDGSFDIGRLKFGLFPLLVGVAVHMVAAKVGLNRAIGRATRGWPIGITV